jgi:hypothetical protein
MTTDIAKLLGSDGGPDDPSNPTDPPEPAVDEPYDMRPDLSDLGIIEMERGVCEDTYENRATLRRAKLQYQPVYDQSGAPTGLIAARSAEAMYERRIQSLAEKRPLLVDPDNKNSDYITGLDLLLEDKALKITPPWVVGSTKAWRAEQEAGGPPTNRRAPKGLPHRCRMVKSDGIRCLLWASGRPKDDGLCRVHLRHLRKPGEDVERARRKLIQAAPYAVDVLEDLMENAESEPVRLKASTEILDRAGIRGGQDLSIEVEVTDVRPAAQVVAERLARLAEGAYAVQARLEALEAEVQTDNSDIVDAEVVEDTEEESGEPVAVAVAVVTSQTDTKDGLDPKPETEFEDLEEEAASS